ncbi:YbaB/EbfC family nucleoid-associated protein [Luteithermobacter gelatinilyticus]|uniref:YbaB/EbfC family nucleoid-associated protein n=1 Tax=Luteithermobacter gelatinilyticus TaxID=2582913 RepID=UPI0011065107|nr:YbaB/EbfC family nucleoid-associated protein [Luteithermobacter gelatinilyticus]
MKNLGKMMKQAQEVQARMQEMQQALEQTEISGSAGAGLVSVTLNGKNDVKKVKIDPSLFNGDDVEVVEDLIVAAFHDAKVKVEEHAREEMKKLTGGLQLPEGFNLPF